MFAGTAISAQYVPPGSGFGGYALVEFKVHTVWKGPLHETMLVKTSTSTCGVRALSQLLDGFPERSDFVPEYIVYAGDWWGDGLWTGLCDLTSHYAGNIQRGFAELGPGRKPIPGSIAPTPVPPPPWLERFETIFSGTIASVRDAEPSSARDPNPPQLVELDVHRVFRGPSYETHAVRVYAPWPNCQFANFISGLDSVNLLERPAVGEYLVYSVGNETNLCLLTDSVENIRREFPRLGLGDGWEPTPGSVEPTPQPRPTATPTPQPQPTATPAPITPAPTTKAFATPSPTATAIPAPTPSATYVPVATPFPTATSVPTATSPPPVASAPVPVEPLTPSTGGADQQSTPSGGACGSPAASAAHRLDLAALGLLAGIPALGVLRRRRL